MNAVLFGSATASIAARSFSEMNIEIFGMTNFIIYTD